ncbi:MAG TPA: hypothetical protein VFS30_03760 [Dehalococcoidia bacterium]|nr:hypothetical protein [Dehalococcoidia bacterium]
MLFQSRGLRLSIAGAILVLISGISLLFLPDIVSGAGMLVGACAVGGGFMWTMIEFYLTPQEPPPDA